MEDKMDVLYGDLDQEHHNTIAAFDEDSVDIYSGLESPSPHIKTNTERNCTLPQQNLKSMDLYEEIITQEQQERQASYDELRNRYKAAQNQVEELLQRLQKVETQNTKLNTENSSLRKNICALIKTAKMEVTRKDEEINRLSQSFRPGRNHAAYRQSQKDCQRIHISTRINPPGPSPQSKPQVPTSPTPKWPSQPYQPPGPRRDGLVQDLRQHLQKNRDVVQSSVTTPASDAIVFRPPLPDEAVSRPHLPDEAVLRPPLPDEVVFRPPLPDEAVLRPPLPDEAVLRPPLPDEAVLRPPLPDEAVLRPPLPDEAVLRPPLPDATVFRPPLPDEAILRPPLPDEAFVRPPLPDDTVLSPPLPVISNVSGVHSEAPVKQRDSPVSHFSKDTVNRHFTRERCTSDHSKQTKHREGRGNNIRLSEQQSKRCPDQEFHSNERNRSHKSHKDSGNYDSRNSKNRYSSSDIAVHRRSGRAKSPASNILDCTPIPDRTYKELNKESVDVDSVGDSRHDKELKGDKEGDRHKHGKDISSKKQSNQCSINGRSVKSLHHKRSVSPLRDRQMLEDRRREDAIAKEKNGSGERSSKRKRTCLDRGKDMNHSRTKEVDFGSLDVNKVKSLNGCKVREQTTHEESEVLPPEAKLCDKSSVEKNSSNKKLSFMETLNLTLSPVKKPSKPAESMEHKLSKPAESMEHNKPSKPAKAMKHNKPSKPAESMEHNKPSKPAESMEHNKPSKPAEAKEHNKPSKPAEAKEHNKPSKPAEAMEHKVTAPEVPEDQSTEDGQPDLEELIVIDEINSTMETEESVEDLIVQPPLEIQTALEPVSIESGPTDKALFQDYDKVVAKTTVDKEELNYHLKVVDSTVHDNAEGKPEFPEVIVEHITESNTQEPLKKDCATVPDCGSILKTSMNSTLEKCDYENTTDNSEYFAATASTMLFESCRSCSNTNTKLSCNRLTPEHSNADSEAVAEKCVDIQNRESPSDLVSKSHSFVSQDPSSAACVRSHAIQASAGNETSDLQLSLLIEPEGLQQLPASVISNHVLEKGVTAEVLDVSRNAVSSTICIEVIPEIRITDVTPDVKGIPVVCEKENPLEEQSSLMSSSIGVSKVSSTTCEVTPSEQHKQGFEHTPKKSLHSEKRYKENEDENVEPSSSISMAHDEDSMMLTLSSLKSIPNAISPLTSPVRPTRKCQQPCHSTLPYAKSLCNALSSAAVEHNSENLEVTKENKNAGCTATKQDVEGKSDCPSSTEKELEEGEIVSESEGEEPTVTESPPTKMVRPKSDLKNQQSPKSFPRLSKNLAKEKLVNHGYSEVRRKTMTSPIKSPTSNKTRYKTVQPQLPNAPLSTVEEIMDIFANIRFECRKKYMKLHSLFSKKTFSGVMDMSLDSFTDFVDCVHLTKICNQEYFLKDKLKNIVKSVLSKLTDNGIVNRIFDQQPLDMKSKLWEFVDSQLDFLFKEIHTALRGVCKSSNTNLSSGAVKNNRNFSGNKVPNQTVSSLKQPIRSSKQPIRSPKQPMRSPKQPVRSSKQPVRSTKQPVRSPKQPVRSPKQPVRSPKQPVRSSKQPVRSPKQQLRSSMQLVRSPKQPVRSPKSSMSTTSRLIKPQGEMQQTKSLTRTLTSKRPPEELAECVQPNMKRSRFQTAPPCRTGLGRGKSIKMTSEVENKELEPQTSDHLHMQPSMQTTLQNRVESLPSHSSSSAERVATYVRRLSQNGAHHDKSDFEILTEQQASSLTFNLVTDTQMGEIFKCLLQGSDLLETNISGADNQGWPLGTPRKEGEHFLDLTTPCKVVTPSKLITTWSAISPQKFSSPNSKIKVPLNPALLDESCMLEVPSGLSESRTTPQYGVFSQRSYSILAEDLAVSLTIPSPLKSDNHLSFLHPASGELASAPDSVISAHFSEDALMDGEDAVEQDIHLALDTDNSSGASSGGGRTSEPSVNPLFHFKPHLPMQAVVMEKSNDHFIVKIRHTDSFNSTNSGINCSNLCINSTNPAINFTNLGNNSSSSSDKFTNMAVNSTSKDIISTSQIVNSTSTGTISTCPVDHFNDPVVNSTSIEINSTFHVANSTDTVVNSTNAEINSSQEVNSSKPSSVNYINTGNNTTHPRNTYINPGYSSTNPGTNCTWVDNSTSGVNCINQSIKPTSKDLNPTAAKSPRSPPIKHQHGKDNYPEGHSYEVSLSSHPFHLSCLSTSTETASELSEPCLSIVEDLPERDQCSGNIGKKRSKHNVRRKAKRAKKEGIPEKSKQKKKSSKSPKGKAHRSFKGERSKVSSPARSTPSPNSLSARNIIVKKGEVVETWTKNEDRDILLSLKMKGSSSDTFSALSEKMNKTPAQIAERFSQLMKLFKKTEKMAS